MQGVIRVVHKTEKKVIHAERISFQEHYKHVKLLQTMIADPALKTFCYHRLSLLDLKFTLYKGLNDQEEVKETKVCKLVLVQFIFLACSTS